eukprot:TRINITY_DN12669_c1_g1_i1.p1 TRINITY_DN12669_c1_g1~~TRINITY_DN12669_c1_g1_i1.p1  ORF type:complete len:130 (-),score=11.53 TRINITY_DN12669_c1_g1_i1:555-944(-)
MISSSHNPAVLASSSSTSIWVIDSMTTDHLIGMCSQFQSYKPTFGGSVKIVDGTFTQVAGKRSISVLPDLSISSILHVPKFSFNLVFVSSLTKPLIAMLCFSLPIVSFNIRGQGRGLVVDMGIMVPVFL